MYVKGSNALKTEYYTHGTAPAKKTGKIKRMPAMKKRAKAVAADKSRLMKRRAVCALTIVFAMAFVILQRYAAITEEYSKLNKSRAKLESLNAQIVEKQMYAEGTLDHKKIESEAEKLGLRPPLKEQVKYVSLGNTDGGEVFKTEEVKSDSAFMNGLAGILEYLY